MSIRRLFSVLLISALSLIGASVNAQDKDFMQPRLVTLVDDAITLSDALKSLQEQSGNSVADRRGNVRDNPKLKLNLKGVTFWQALDEIVSGAQCGYSLYQDDDRLVLVDVSSRRLNAYYSGICRLAVKRVSVVREEESGNHFCNLVAELAWEPRFHPFYLDIGAAEVVFAPDATRNAPKVKSTALKVFAPGQFKLDERCATEFELRLPAPQRGCPSVESLSCQLKLVGPAKMLTFRLTDLAPNKVGVEQTKENVKVVFKPLPQRRDRWSFDVIVYNPPGSHRFESYQERDWLIHNRIYLEKVDGGKTSVIAHQPEGEEPIPDDPTPFSFKRAGIRYNFAGNMPEKTAGWNLVYRTPSQIVDLPLSFALRNILLP